ncbi:MAG: glycosyltransferase family 4 protein [Phycisphaerae bacterium]|nr:glycosyltransferase family 4 protein [Phycisphaerae bacterium]
MPRSKTLQDRPAIAFLSDYLPRQCGIATFTHDLCEAVATQAGRKYEVFAVATNDVPEGYPYPERVRFEMRQSVRADYRLAAEFLNIQQVSAVCLQHEYGIFGGACGSHILALLTRLRRPLVTTLHTVLKEPSRQQLQVLKQIAEHSDRIVVMSDVARGMLGDIYDVPEDKIALIPHGIPDVPFVDPTFFKDQFGVEGRTVMLTFGLLSPGKGIEYAIEALPKIVAEHPEIIYIVLGATHPHIKRESGEEYRNALMRRVNELGMSDHVMFVNRFVEMDELCEFLGAADLYVTPYLQEAQITSGTLAYAMGTGKAVVSTAYWYAQEMLADERGRLVPFRNSDAIAEQVVDLLDNETERHAIRKRAYNYCRKMTWKRVAQDYLDLFQTAREAWVERQHRVAETPRERGASLKEDELPEIDLRHLRTLTDMTGILQHCRFATPDRNHGYTTEDNARALIVATRYWDQTHDEGVLRLMQTYLSFLSHALDEQTGRFRGYMHYNRTWDEAPGDEDSHARALWGVGCGVALCPYESMIALATRLFLNALPAVEEFSSPRAWSYAIVGIHEYLCRFGGDSEVRRYRHVLAEKLMDYFEANMSDDWPWCEHVVTYANATLPHALLMSGKWLQNGRMIDIGKRVLAWLLEIQTNEDGHLSIIGTQGWYARGGERARFDQQPLEAHALVNACVEAYHVTRETYWLGQARKAFTWFLGDNDLRIPLHDFTTGGCRDALHADHVNENQGAESTLSWLIALLLMHEMQTELTLGEPPADKVLQQRPVPRAIKPSGPVVATKVEQDARTDRNGQ